jgi:hypothetical protein
MMYNEREMKEQFNCRVRFKNTKDNKVVALPTKKIDDPLHDAIGRYKDFLLIGFGHDGSVHYQNTDMSCGDLSYLLIALQKLVYEWVEDD